MIFTVINSISLAVVLVVNGFFSLGWLGKSVKAISDERKTVLTPTALTFFIWIIIYSLQIAFVVFAYIAYPDTLVESIGFYYLVLSILNILWVVAWCFERIELCGIIITGMLGVVFQIYSMFGISYFQGENQIKFWLYNAPFSMYFGWLCVAAVLNFFVIGHYDPVGVADAELKLEADSSQGMVAIILLVLPCVFLLYNRNDFIFAGTVAWGLIGIFIAHHDNRKINTGIFIDTLILVSVIIWRIVAIAEGIK